MIEKLRKAKEGNKKELQEIIESFNPLIRKSSLKFYIKGLDQNDIKQIATLAIIKSIKQFNLEKGDNFPAYAKAAVKNTLIREMIKAENKYYKEKINSDINEVFNIEEVRSQDLDLNDNLINKEESNNLVRIINLLSQEDQKIIKALYIERIKIKDYSESNNIPYGNLVYRKNKILKILREEYKKII